MHKSRVYDVTHCYNLGKIVWEKVPSCRLIKCLVSVFLHTSLVPSCTLFTAVLPKRLYKTPTPYIHYHLQDKTHRSHHGLIKRARQTPSLLTLSPFPLFLHWRSPLSIFLNFLGYARVSILFCNLDFIGCHVFDINSVRHIYFQGQYSLHFFPFVCSIFLVLFFALVVFLSNPFLVILFLQPLPRFQSYKGV